ncbi:hypothetical protein [Hymenobacter glacieicola]|uniref:DUF1508 domain-containing protein n=1 Tax=Hymenobacter glacieicola TaxID=1562124 RepID=A0ABQ1X707_9BACT|nr:hypothetical protein [Hymenobacter glacieicola]GGG60936.1 hypothetical protein GCM10011378_41170 [Hymenobacter glacieicola]
MRFDAFASLVSAVAAEFSLSATAHTAPAEDWFWVRYTAPDGRVVDTEGASSASKALGHFHRSVSRFIPVELPTPKSKVA